MLVTLCRIILTAELFDGNPWYLSASSNLFKYHNTGNKSCLDSCVQNLSCELQSEVVDHVANLTDMYLFFCLWTILHSSGRIKIYMTKMGLFYFSEW